MLKRILLFIAAPFAIASSQPRAFVSCWLRPAPAPACRNFLVTEASAEVALNKPSSDESRGRFMLTGGLMHNTNGSSAIGGTVAWDLARGWSRPARAEFRYRQWQPSTALDFSGGIAQRGVSTTTGGVTRIYGPTVATGLEWKYVALDLRGEFLNGVGRSYNNAYVGARATSVGAPIALLGGLAVIFAVVASAGAS
jgi:hypothetical protein